jgi:hypothetical protein
MWSEHGMVEAFRVRDRQCKQTRFSAWFSPNAPATAIRFARRSGRVYPQHASAC